MLDKILSGPVLVVAAHPDDEVLGCGGTIAKLVNSGADVHCLIGTEGVSSRENLSEPEKQDQIANLRNKSKLAHLALGIKSTENLSLPDNSMDLVPLLKIVKSIEIAIENIRPQIVFTHSNTDVNVDHRLLNDAVLAATRPTPGSSVKLVAFFEIASSTEWRFTGKTFQPNLFIDITDEISLKMDALRCYESEMRNFPHPRSYEGVMSLSKWRGPTVGAMHAEAFELSRLKL